MAEKQMRVPADLTRINTGDPLEMNYWKKKFGVKGAAITGAVRVVGNKSAKAIESYLKEEAAHRKAMMKAEFPKRRPTREYSRVRKVKRVPDDLKTVNTKDPGEMLYWREKFGVGSMAIIGAVRVVGNNKAKEIEQYLKEEAAYRKAMQQMALTGRGPLPRNPKEARMMLRPVIPLDERPPRRSR